MHELSLAMSLLDLAHSEAERSDPNACLLAMQVEVGKLAGVDAEALRFCLDSLLAATNEQDIAVEFEQVEPLSCCNRCMKEFVPERRYSSCPRCGSFETEARQGWELKLKSITIE